MRVSCCEHSLFHIFTHEKCCRFYVQQASHIALPHAQITTNQHLEYLQVQLIREDEIHVCVSSACVAYTFVKGTCKLLVCQVIHYS